MSYEPTNPLHDLLLEQNVIAACMQSNEACWKALSLNVEAGDFYSEQNRILWQAIEDIGSNGSGRADEVQVVDWLRNQGQLALAGGAAGVSRVTDILPAMASLPDHVATLKELHRSRDIRQMCMSVLMQDSIQGQMEQLEEGFSKIMVASHDRLTMTVADAANTFEIDDLGEGVDYSGIFPRLDGLLRFRRGALITLGATPGSGKTSLALQIAANISRHHPVLIASAEMRMREVIERYVAMMTGFGPATLQNPNAVQREAIAGAVDELKTHTNLTVMEPGNLTPAKIAGRARVEILKSGPLGLIVVDYLQLLTLPHAGRTSREQVVGELARQCKEMAQSLDVPVLMLSQLSRDHKKHKRAPDLHDLRESGGIEAHSDAAFFLDRKDDEEETMVYIRKNRHGLRGRMRMAFCNGAKFREYEGSSR